MADTLSALLFRRGGVKSRTLISADTISHRSGVKQRKFLAVHVICFVWLLGWRLVCALEWFLGCRWWFIAYASQGRPKSVRPTELRRDLSGATPLAARRDSGALSLSMAATLGRVKDGLFRAGGALDGRRCSTHPNEQAPTLVRESSMYRATRQGWGPHGQPPSWLLPAHSPGRSRPLSRP